MQPKAMLCKAEASSRTKSENESHQPQLDMALLEDRDLLSQEVQNPLTAAAFNPKPPKTYMHNKLPSLLPVFENQSQGRALFA